MLGEERAGKNRKSMITWIEEQLEQSLKTPAESTPTDASVPDVEPVYVVPETEVSPKALEGIDSLEGGWTPIGELIAILCQERDRLQRSTSCGVENIKVHLSDIQISV